MKVWREEGVMRRAPEGLHEAQRDPFTPSLGLYDSATPTTQIRIEV